MLVNFNQALFVQVFLGVKNIQVSSDEGPFLIERGEKLQKGKLLLDRCSGFSSPELKAQVSFSDRPLSIVYRYMYMHPSVC
jgi:hypothetical protein